MNWEKDLRCPKCSAKFELVSDCFVCNGRGRVDHAQYIWYGIVKKAISNCENAAIILGEDFVEDLLNESN